MASLATPIQRYSGDVLYPFRRRDLAIRNAIRLVASTSFARGQILAELTGTNCIDLLTIGGTPTSGSFTISWGGYTTAAITWSATNATLLANIQTALNNLVSIGPLNTLVTTLSLSAGIGTINITFRNGLGAQIIALPTTDTTLLVGTAPTAVITQTTAGVAGSNGTFQAYNSGGNDGSQTPKCFLSIASTTDANGLITLGDGTLGNDNFAKVYEVDAWFGGIFRVEDLALDNTGAQITTGALAALTSPGSIIEGTINARGIMEF